MASDDDRAVFTAKAVYQAATTRTHLAVKDDLSITNGSAAGTGWLLASPQPGRRMVLSLLSPDHSLSPDVLSRPRAVVHPLEHSFLSVGSPTRGFRSNTTPEPIQAGVNDTLCVFTPHLEVS